jgi:hypothetical protein
MTSMSSGMCRRVVWYIETNGSAVPWFIRIVAGLTAEAQFQSQANPCWICGGNRGTGAGFSASRIDSTFPLSLSFHQCSVLITSAVTDATKSHKMTACLKTHSLARVIVRISLISIYLFYLHSCSLVDCNLLSHSTRVHLRLRRHQEHFLLRD